MEGEEVPVGEDLLVVPKGETGFVAPGPVLERQPQGSKAGDNQSAGDEQHGWAHEHPRSEPDLQADAPIQRGN